MKRPALYISYFSLQEPLVQTQVIPYLRELVAGGWRMSLLTFDAPGKALLGADADRWRAQLADQGITWKALPYHERPSLPAKLYDIVQGAALIRRWAREIPFEVLHARSHVAAAMALLARRGTSAKVLFDFRGLLADEYVDAGHWAPGGLPYRLTKAAEGRLIEYSDGFVVLTERCRELLFADDHRPLQVIPCCVDGGRFGLGGDTEALRRRHGVEGRTAVYVGGLDGFYLPEEVAEQLAMAWRTRGLRPLVVTRADSRRLEARFASLGLTPADYSVVSATPAEIPAWLATADVAVSFIKPSFSKLSSSSTKVPEYLAAGLPVIANANVGDMESQILGARVGVMAASFTPEGYRAALDGIDALKAEGGLAARCRAASRSLFGLAEVGGPRYRALYEQLVAGPTALQSGVAA